MKNRKRNRLFLLLILLLGVTVGFALISTTLKINGISRVKKASWDIHWEKVANEAGVDATTPAHIKENTDNQVVEYEVYFEEPGQYYEFTVDAVNSGTLDGIIESISSKVNGADISTLPEYINYSIKYADGTEVKVDDELKKNESKTYKIRVEYDKEKITPEVLNAMTEDQRYEFSFEVKYVQKVKTPSSAPAPVDFAKDSWETIASVGALSDPTTGPYQVGDTKTIEVDLNGDGTNETYTLRLVNLSKPSECSGEGFSQTACGLVVEFSNIIDMKPMNTTVDDTVLGGGAKGGWEYSYMRAYLNGTVYAKDNTDFSSNGVFTKLPSDLQDAIIDTTVVSGKSYNDTANYTTTDKLYLASLGELAQDQDGSTGTGFDYYDAAFYNTRILDYYRTKNIIWRGSTTDNVSEIYKTFYDTASPYWTRSACSQSSYAFEAVMPNQVGEGQQNANNGLGVVPLFRIG